MDATSIRSYLNSQERARFDGNALWTWLLCFGLIAYLGLEGGGYDPLVNDAVAIAVWWVLLAGVLVGALPRGRPTILASVALGLLATFAVWTAIGLGWTESSGKTATDLARVLGFVGVFALALATRGTDNVRHVVAAVGAGIAFVSILALLSRLHPAWFPTAGQTAILLNDPERLSYPVNYWNALAALVAIGLPLLLQVATGAKTIVFRALAAAAIPAMALTAFFTLSRGGIAAAIVVVFVYLAFTSDRLPKLLTALVAAAGSAILIVASLDHEALRDGLLNSTARGQGDEMLALTLAVCAAVALCQAGISVALERGKRPRWTHMSQRQTIAAASAGAVVALIVAVALDVPGRAGNGWDEFKEGGGPGTGTGRLGSTAGESRYQFWSAALRQNAENRLGGTGSGTFEFWWARDGDTDDTVRDTHSLYMQTLGELGIVGFALLAGFLLALLVGGGRLTLRAPPAERALLAAALAGCTAFCLIAVFDWIWQIPVVAVALLLLGSALVGGGSASADSDARRLPLPARLGFAAVALAAIVAIAIPLASTSLLRESEADARAGDLDAALEAARGAQNAQPGAAAPRLQQALVLEELGRLAAAETAAREATAREETNWRNWLVLSRIEAERGRAAAAVRDYRKARSLNPHFSLFSP
jgi:Flp pilus assembly protein TadD